MQQQTGCKIFTSGLEAAFTNYPVLEPSFLYGGYPFKEFRDKFLLAQPSNAVDIGDPDFPNELEIIPLPGHFFDMIGIRTPDDVVFLGDCVSSRAVLERYQICFIYDIAEYLILSIKWRLWKRLYLYRHIPKLLKIYVDW